MAWAHESTNGERRTAGERRTGGERRNPTLIRHTEDRRRAADRRHTGPEQAWDGGPSIDGPGRPTPVVAFTPEDARPAPSSKQTSTFRGLLREEHDAIPSVAAVAGHPLHPLVVPIPLATLVLTVATDLAYVLNHDRFWARAGRLLTGVGVASGVAAAGLGAVDFIGRSRVRDHRIAWLHAGGNAAALLLATASLAMRSPRRATPLPGPLLLSGAAGAILGVTGWLGGELSYRHRMGVTSTRRGA